VSDIASALAHNLYGSVFRTPHWRIGWRRLSGPDLWDTRSLSDTRWTILPNSKARFFADPMPLTVDGKTTLFVEDYFHDRNKGAISAVEFDESGPVAVLDCVLEEPWHLSYPFVFQAEGEIWMVPESLTKREIALYRADPFPGRWTRHKVLIENIAAVDSTIIRYHDRFWLFTTIEHPSDTFADLCLFSAASLFGPWLPHPRNPVVRNASFGRSAGPILYRDGKLLRPAQDCSRRYGAAVVLTEIQILDEENFAHEVCNALSPCREWPGRRLHTLSRSGDLEFIDGSAHAFRWSG